MSRLKENILKSLKTPAPFTYDLAIGGAIVIAVLGVFLFFKGAKTKEDYSKITGHIISLEQRYSQRPARNFGDYRYLQIDRLPVVFEIYVGRTPKEGISDKQKIDNLKIGESVTLYFEESSENDDQPNFGLYFLDRNGKPYYYKPNTNKSAAYFCFTMAALLVAITVLLQKKGIIQKGVM